MTGGLIFEDMQRAMCESLFAAIMAVGDGGQHSTSDRLESLRFGVLADLD